MPAIGLLVVAMVVGQLVVYRLENPAPPSADWPRDRVPYPGLDAYDEDEAAVYFDRDAQAAELTRRLHATATGLSDRFLLRAGASGSGESSLVRGGVLPRLRERRWTVVPPFSPATGRRSSERSAGSVDVPGVGSEDPALPCRATVKAPQASIASGPFFAGREARPSTVPMRRPSRLWRRTWPDGAPARECLSPMGP
ncbi:hypothetical protein ACIGO6_03570 [Streptomyces sp. NPDC053750]|uniref:nSTAND1 domain-containing NTPase n=1 Tax=Streptomyces sp. NPDC053750 TaxID=3365714 RepID=UPI0037CDF128